MRLVSVIRSCLASVAMLTVTAAVVTAMIQPTAANGAELPAMKRINTKPVPCGVASNSMGVFAVTSQGQAACPAAIKVANKYLRQRGKSEPVGVKVDQYRWECRTVRQRQQRYLECVKQVNPTERVRLVS